MEITFTRSGGFVSLPINLQGTVVFHGKTAQVTSEPGYRRELAAEEAASLQQLAANLPETLPKRDPGALRDAYQYDIRVARDNDRVLEFTVHGESAPATGGLVDWIRRECDRIWAYRTGPGAGKDD